MSATALAAVPLAAVQQLVDAGRLRAVPVDEQRAAGFLAVADERLNELATIGSAVVRHGVAYDAAHDVGEAFLAAYGYATTNGPGQHAAIADFLAAVIDAPPVGSKRSPEIRSLPASPKPAELSRNHRRGSSGG